MGNLNFQDDPNENPQQNQPDQSHENESKFDDSLIDDPMSNSKALWVAVVVVLIAAIGGALYMLNKAGYLNFSGKHKTAVTTLSAPPPSAPTTMPSASKTTPAPKMTSAGPQGPFALQVSAFKTRAQADRFVKQLQKKGIESRVVSGGTAPDKTWYKVYTGSFDTKLKAIAAVEGMKRRVGTDVWVVPAQ